MITTHTNGVSRLLRPPELLQALVDVDQEIIDLRDAV